MNVIIRKIKPGKHGVMGDGFGEKTPFVQRNVSRSGIVDAVHEMIL